MTEVKRYEILEFLPTYGPMYIPVTESGEPFYSEGVAIRFYKSDGTNWVANFQPGWTDLKEVHEFKDDERLLVVARGTCYITTPFLVIGFLTIAHHRQITRIASQPISVDRETKEHLKR